MARVRLTGQSEKDLLAILAYYDEVSPEFSLIFEENIIKQLRRLENFPRVGRMVPEIEDTAIRELLYRSYRIVYFVDDEDEIVDILTIFHSSRQLGANLSGED